MDLKSIRKEVKNAMEIRVMKEWGREKCFNVKKREEGSGG
jgi:hypothetical protein